MEFNWSITHERVDDIPLLIGLMRRLRLAETLDSILGRHGNHQGLSHGWLAVVWLAYILSEGDHRKYTVAEWVSRHRHTLECLIEQPIGSQDFTDDRLGILLRYLSDETSWHAIESALWQCQMEVYALPSDAECSYAECSYASVRLDSTTTYGYHTVVEGRLMQHGHSKDHRPELAQLKLMLAVGEPMGGVIASDVHPGQAADDPLYVPLIGRVRSIVGEVGMLYTGDSKMSALETRADIVSHGDFYLVPLARTGSTQEAFPKWVERVVDGAQAVTLVWNQEPAQLESRQQGGPGLLGGGYEFERLQQATVAEQPVTWVERVQLFRSATLAQRQEQQLERRLTCAQETLNQLTPPPGRGRRPYRDEAALQAAITDVLEQHQLLGLLQVHWTYQETCRKRYGGRGRPGPQQPYRIECKRRYGISQVTRDEDAIAQQKYRLGWQLYVTNLPNQPMSLEACVRHYRKGVCVEQDFHQLKDKPLGIQPLYVRCEDQLLGLTHLLTLGLRLLTLVKMQVRRALEAEGDTLEGLVPGQPRKATVRPTAKQLLQAFVRAEITLTRIETDDGEVWHVTPLSALLERILAYLGLSVSLYTRLVENST